MFVALKYWPVKASRLAIVTKPIVPAIIDPAVNTRASPVIDGPLRAGENTTPLMLVGTSTSNKYPVCIARTVFLLRLVGLMAEVTPMQVVRLTAVTWVPVVVANAVVPAVGCMTCVPLVLFVK